MAPNVSFYRESPAGLPVRLSAAARLNHSLLRALRALAAAVVVLCCLFGPASAHAQQAKSIEGKVLAAGTNAPALPGAIIYLQDQKTNVIKTAIAVEDGGYRFSQLPADTDYQVWAEYQGKKSKVRLVNSFDTKQNVTQNFHIGSK